ncbi:hypothetical protein EST38_g6135 [Candolleomyces aberdarensis]|uniref:Uncharacterized protein n=1 Tax=Candolleomyces aberdarensis TaxID=2316362 RepID=A0A4Q2DIC2_9AGAR|nr:hypothetical protein EST38_g6135 [Candolleomyces aberdarensis]
MQLFKDGHRVDGFNLKLCELLDVIDRAVAATSTLDDLKIVLWRLRILNASNSLDVLKLFNEVAEFSDRSLVERDPILPPSGLSGFTQQELQQLCSLLMDEITPAPWQTNRLDANYQMIIAILKESTYLWDDQGLEIVRRFLQVVDDERDFWGDPVKI